MVILIIVVLLLLSACRDWEEAEDWERAEYNAELRHQELMEVYRKKSVRPSVTKTTRRRVAKDKHGNVLAEEISIEEEDDEY